MRRKIAHLPLPCRLAEQEGEGSAKATFLHVANSVHGQIGGPRRLGGYRLAIGRGCSIPNGRKPAA